MPCSVLIECVVKNHDFRIRFKYRFFLKVGQSIDRYFLYLSVRCPPTGDQIFNRFGFYISKSLSFKVIHNFRVFFPFCPLAGKACIDLLTDENFLSCNGLEQRLTNRIPFLLAFFRPVKVINDLVCGSACCLKIAIFYRRFYDLNKIFKLMFFYRMRD